MEEVASSGAEAKTGGLAREEKEISISAFFAALGVLVPRTKAVCACAEGAGENLTGAGEGVGEAGQDRSNAMIQSTGERRRGPCKTRPSGAARACLRSAGSGRL